jgi:hypothetical protein
VSRTPRTNHPIMVGLTEAELRAMHLAMSQLDEATVLGDFRPENRLLLRTLRTARRKVEKVIPIREEAPPHA